MCIYIYTITCIGCPRRWEHCATDSVRVGQKYDTPNNGLTHEGIIPRRC